MPEYQLLTDDELLHLGEEVTNSPRKPASISKQSLAGENFPPATSIRIGSNVKSRKSPMN
jgi:hypothetical protein